MQKRSHSPRRQHAARPEAGHVLQNPTAFVSQRCFEIDTSWIDRKKKRNTKHRNPLLPMNTKWILATALAFGMATSASAHAGSNTWTTIDDDAAEPHCRQVQKHKIVEKPRKNMVKQKDVYKDCCKVYKHKIKMEDGVVVKDRPKSRMRHNWYGQCP